MMKLIIPPSEIRLVIEKLAAYVVKNGPSFEDKILEKERLNPRFSFLFPTDPYHAYYQNRLQEYYEVGPEGADDLLAQSNAQLEASLSIRDPRESPKQKIPVTLSPPPPPPSLEFLIEFTGETCITALDYDVIKLTAQYVSRNGRPFLAQLCEREGENAQFAFLKPHHSLHRVFLQLVGQYQRIYPPSSAQLEQLRQLGTVEGRNALLNQCIQRAHHRHWSQEEEQRKREEEEREKQEFASIDWNDFTIIEMIEFSANERTGLNPLPPPISLPIIRGLSLVQRRDMWNRNYTGCLTLTPDKKETKGEGEEEEKEIEVETTSVYVKPPSVATDATPSKWPSHLPVRTDYTPKAIATAKAPITANFSPMETEICPICNQAIAKAHIAEHIRIEALDPKWKEQRDRYLAKHRDTNLVTSSSDVVYSLGQLNRVRADLAAMSEAEREETIREANRQTQQRTVVWDGRMESVPAATKQAMKLAKPILAAQMQAISASVGGQEQTVNRTVDTTEDSPITLTMTEPTSTRTTQRRKINK